MGAVRELYEEAIRRYIAGDVDGFAGAHSEDAVLVTPAGSVRGRAAIRDHWLAQRAAFPDLALTLNLVLEQGTTVASEWTWTGTHTGPLVVRGAEVPATGRRVELHGMEVAHLRNGQITEYHMYWDGMALAGQLGLLPKPTPAG